MITEDYVSFQTAKLLKEKGFDEKCPCYYRKKMVDNKIVDEEELFVSAHLTLTNSELEDKAYRDIVYCSTPTIQMAMKWLREVHNLFIECGPRLSFTDFYWITANIYRVRKKSSLYHTEDVDDYRCVAICNSHSYEEACEAAIKYCLEKLI